MIIVSKPTSPISDVGILLGRQGENKARQIVFDLSWLIEEYGNGTAVLVHQRSKDGAPYICTTSQSDSTLTWTLSNLDTAYDGWGEAELRWTVGTSLAKTLIYKTMVVRSITSDSEIPDPYESWYDQMIEYINENAVTYQELGQAIEDYIAEHPISAPVQSVNGKTGTVVLTASDVGAGTYSKPSGGIPASDIASGVIPAIDATLSTAGKAADAKATGDAIALKANTNSPTFTGTPKTPTASTSTSNTEIASTAFVHNVVTSELGRLDDVWSGTCATAASTAAKVVAIDGTGIDLSTNPIIVVYFSKGNSASTPTIKLGSNGTAYPIHYQTNNGTSTEQMNSASMMCYWGIGVRIFKFVTNKWIDVMPDMYHVYTLQNELSGKYEKPSGGIPSSDMASAVQTSLGKADSAYQKPSGGIPSTDLSSAVQTSLGKADTALQTAPVSSVNTKTGAVSLDAGDLGYDGTETYTSGTVGKAISDLNGDLSDIDERVTALEQGGSGGLSESVKQALLQIASKVAYVDADGQEYYSDLYDAFYPPANLVSITAVYTQSGTVYTTDSLDSLKSDLVVTALYDDQTTATVTTYTLSGTLTEGTSSITVTYGGKTTTFTVTVTAATLSSISAVYTQSGTVYTTDSLDSLKTDLVVTAHWSNNTTSTVASADYTLSGTLTVGTSTITVSYEGKTTTFTVTVTDHSALPEGYTKYDYIANTLTVGTASSGNYDAILTDIDMSSDYTYETKILIPSSASSITNASPLMGTRNGASGTKQFGLFFTPSTGKLGYWFGGTDTATTITGLSLGSVLDIKIRPVGASSTYPTKATIIVNNTEYDAGSTASGQTWNSWFSFLKYAISATSVITSNQKAIGAQIGETKIKDGNTVLYDFIPCNNGTYYGVYELINGVFYYDATNYSNWTGGDWEV